MRIHHPRSAAAVERLIALGETGVGGIESAGEDGDGGWVERTPPTPTLSVCMRDGVSWRDAIELVASLAAAQAACEKACLFPGALWPDAICVRDGCAEIRADRLVAAMLGMPAPVEEPLPTRWMSPELAAAGQPDNASNRYAIGLILYRLLSGEHAFSGQSLRRRMEDQARRGAAPFAYEVAKQLPPGLETLCLRMLDAEPTKRPGSAAELADRLSRLAGDGLNFSTEINPDSEQLAASRSEPDRAQAKPLESNNISVNKLRPSPLLVVGLVAAGVAIAAVAIGSAAAPGGVAVRPTAPIEKAIDSDDCAGCHARQSAEWHRSVMGHAAKSPLFQSLEILIQEQVGRDVNCPDGAGILRVADPQTACREGGRGLAITGSGGEHWCVNCHSPGENLEASMPAWDGVGGSASSRLPLRDLLPDSSMQGISCAFCHQVGGPVQPGNAEAGLYEGNPFWTSTRSGLRFSMRPEDRRGPFGIANSGYLLRPSVLVGGTKQVSGGTHAALDDQTRRYMKSSEFCGACHDVRLFGTDVIGASKGEHFKRLRNAYSEWVDWAGKERAAGREPASCQDCHMSSYPGICVPGARSDSVADRACPPGTRFAATRPGTYPQSRSPIDGAIERVSTHQFSGVDIPMAAEFPATSIDDPSLDTHGIPLGARQRRDLLLARTFELAIDGARDIGRRIEVPIVIENTGAGHRVPAGFSQEREFWIHFRVTDASGRVVYEVGRVDRHDENLHDKVFERVNTSEEIRDGLGRPLGMFGADLSDGPDVPRWSPNPARGGTEFRGEGLINFQNGFLRCVRCIGIIDEAGRCQPRTGQGITRADRYADGEYDPDSGRCFSNLQGENALFEVYFPVGALDATRGVVRGPDAIVDTRSVPPGVPIRYVYDLPVDPGAGPFTVEAHLMFRAFPPFLIEAFADYEERQSRLGLRPSGPLITRAALDRLEVVEIASAKATLQ